MDTYPNSQSCRTQLQHDEFVHCRTVFPYMGSLMATKTTFEYRGSRCSFIVGLLGQIDEQEDHLEIKEDSDIVTFQWLSSHPKLGNRQISEDVHFAALTS